MAADRNSSPDEVRLLGMLDRIADAAKDYESTADDLPPVTDDEVRRYQKEHRR